MPDTILVVVEQREGKLNRVSWETITAGQAIAGATGWGLEAAVVGSGVNSIASEVAGKKVAKVYDIESPKLEPYTPDAFTAGLKQFLESRQPKLVLMPVLFPPSNPANGSSCPMLKFIFPPPFFNWLNAPVKFKTSINEKPSAFVLLPIPITDICLAPLNEFTLNFPW